MRRTVSRIASTLNRDPGAVQAAARNHVPQVWEAAARYLGLADPDDPEALRQAGSTHLAIVGNTTAGLGLLYSGIAVRADQEIVTTRHDFAATLGAIRHRSHRDGTRARLVELYNDARTADADSIVDNVRKAIRDETRVLAFTWVHSGNGLKIPLARIGQLVEDINRHRFERDHIILCADAVHGLGVEDADFPSLKCHFIVSGCHKWLFGPRGTGIICGTPDAWQHVTPTTSSLRSGSGTAIVNTPGGVHAYEHQWGLARAFRFHTDIGRAAISGRTHALARQLKNDLARLKGVTVVTPVDPDVSAGLVCFRVDRKSAYAVVRELFDDHSIRATASARDVNDQVYVSVSPSIVTDERDLDALVCAIKAIAP